MKFFYFFLPVFCLPAFSLKETDYPFVYKLLDDKSFYHIGEFKGQANATLKYARFGKAKGKKGPVIFINGRGENLFKYIELFYDLTQKGWSPIYTYDHRGQGFSRHLLNRKTWGDIEHFAYYTKDLKSFLNVVKQETQKKSFFVIAHSMGALIAVDYVQKYGAKNWKALILSAPMFGIQISLATGFTYLKSMYCNIISCLNKRLDKKNRLSLLSYSKTREGFFRYLQKTRYPETKVVVPSQSWIQKNLKAASKAINPKEVKKITVPILILKAKQDVVIKNKLLNEFCELLPKNCELDVFPGKHELFIEKDIVRDQVIHRSLEFFKRP